MRRRTVEDPRGRESTSAPGVPAVAMSSRLKWSGYLIGFSLGGFFDGILLHQVLQWHHLLSALETGWLSDLRAQVMIDGLFHAAMYVVAAIGLWMLFASRHEHASSAGNRWLL